MSPRLRLLAGALAAVLVALVAVPPAHADKLSEARRKRKEVQEQRAHVAAQVDALKATAAELQRALDALEADVRSQQASVASARQAAAAAAAAARRARDEEQRTAARLAELRAAMRSLAVDAYVKGPTRDLVVALDTATLNDVARRRQLIQVAAGRSGAIADELRAVGEDLTIRRAEAEAAEQRARERRAAEEATLAKLAAAERRQESVAEDAEERLDRALAEADALAAVDQALAAEIAREQAELARRLAARQRQGVARASRRIGNVPVVNVRGIVVHADIAGQVEALLAAAEADGIVLGGGGYRSSESQIALRRAHCGSSNYAIYDMPPSQCGPPTARPGSSMHERGLAIDFTYEGRVITSRSSPAFRWLAANAGRYGLRNLPSEPWHWSTNGQ